MAAPDTHRRPMPAHRPWPLLGVLALIVTLVALNRPPSAVAPRTLRGTLSLETALSLRFQPADPGGSTSRRMLGVGKGSAALIEPDRLTLLPRPRKGSATASRLAAVIRFAGARPGASLSGENRLPLVARRLTGRQSPQRPAQPIPQFGRVRCREAYRGVDVVYYGNDERLEFDFEVAPGANPGSIVLALPSAHLTSTGRLFFGEGDEAVVLERPVAYQEGKAGREPVECSYLLAESGQEARFELGSYDRGRRLVIDPVVGFSTTVGGFGAEYAAGMAFGPDGSIYLAGTTDSNDLPVTTGLQPFPGGFPGYEDGFVARLSPTGELLAITYLGGTMPDTVVDVETDAAGNVYVAGSTSSNDFPHLEGIPSFTKAFVVRLSSDLSQLGYTRFFGFTSSLPIGLAVDPAGHAVLATPLSFNDTVLQRLSPSGQEILYSAGFAGRARALVCDATGNTYLTGWGLSASETTPNAYDRIPDGNTDAFVVKLGPTGEAIYATLLGGSDIDEGLDIAVDLVGRAHVIGNTASLDFPVRDAAQPARAAVYDAFVARLNADGSALTYSTYLGGSGFDCWRPSSTYQRGKIAVAPDGSFYAVGITDSSDFPRLDPIGPVRGGSSNLFVAAYGPLGALRYATRYGSSFSVPRKALTDSAGNIYVAGGTESTFPVVGVPSSGAGPNAAFCFMLTPEPTPVEPPVRPGSVQATSQGMTKIRLTWSDPNANEDGQRVERAIGTGPWEALVEVGPNVRELLDINLTPATTHRYRISAYNSGGASEFSQESSATTQTFIPPANLYSERSSASTLKLYWSDYNHLDAHTWELERANAAGSFEIVATGSNTSGSSQTYTDTPPARDVIYTYRLRFRMGSYLSGYSDAIYARAGESRGKLVVSPVRLAFGNPKVGQVVRKTFLVRNTGRSALVTETFGHNELFYVVSGAERRLLLPRQSFRVTVEFRPTAAGRWADTVFVTADTPPNKEVSVQLQARSRP